MVVVYSSAISAFQRDKHQFFSQIKPSNQLTTSVQLVDQRANTLEYSFILNNKQALEDEFNQQFHLLKNQGVGNNEHFWLYCYYCASLLEHFHRAYAQPDKEEHYKQIKTDIKKRLHLPVEEASETEDNQFAQQLHRSFLDGFHAFIDPVCHVSKIREYVAYANLCRIYWVFSRLTITEGLSLAKGGQFLDTFDAILGTHTDVDKVIASIQRPAQILTYFGVGFFLLRFMIDAGVLLKHTFYPSELEQGADRGCEVNKMQHLPGAVSIEAYRSSYILVDNAQDNPSLFYVPKEGPVVRLTEVTTKLAALTEQLKTTPTIRLTS